MARLPRVTISEEGLSKLREEMSAEEIQLGLARIQELLVTMRENEENKVIGKKLLGLTDEELEKLDSELDADHGALYLKIDLALKDEFGSKDIKNINRIIRLHIRKTLATFDLDMIEELAKRSLDVHVQNLERERQAYYDEVEKRASNPQTEPEK